MDIFAGIVAVSIIIISCVAYYKKIHKLFRLLEIILLVLVTLFAFYSWRVSNDNKQIALETLNETRVDIKQRYRPFLTFTVRNSSEQFSYKELKRIGRVKFAVFIKNHGEVPAYRVDRTVLAMVDAVPIFSVRITTPNPTTRGTTSDGLPYATYAINPSNRIIAPDSEDIFEFDATFDQIEKLINAKEKDKFKTGIMLMVKYAGPLGNATEQSYFYQENIIPWIKDNTIAFKSEFQAGN